MDTTPTFPGLTGVKAQLFYESTSQKSPPFHLSDALLMLLLQFSLFPVDHRAVQDNTVGCLSVSHPRATQGMGSAKARGGQQHGWAGLLYPGTVSTPRPEKLLGSSCGGSKARVDLPSSVIPHLSVSE